MATALPETPTTVEHGLTLRPPVTGTTAVTVNVPEAPKARVPEWYEASGLTAAATMIGVLFTVGFGVWNTGKQLKNASAEAERQRASDREKEDRQRTRDIADAAESRAHDRDEAQVDRLMTARRQVYMDLVDKFMATQAFFGGLSAQRPGPPPFGQELHDLGKAINKTWLLSEAETAYKARELFNILNEQFFRMLPKLNPIIFKADLIQEYTQRRTEAEQLLKFWREQKPQDFYEDEVTAALARLDEFDKLVEALQGERDKLTRAFSDEIMGNQPNIMDQVNAFMSDARKEMGLKDEGGILEQQSTDMTERMKAAMQRFYFEIEAQAAVSDTED